ncbi:uncharacterized protein [Watersipora subatra]|uniref:uncharacterized protein n=1 Tax=Watersipora subatra TaxID=2589382 RepID=UPI00355BA8DA
MEAIRLVSADDLKILLKDLPFGYRIKLKAGVAKLQNITPGVEKDMGKRTDCADDVEVKQQKEKMSNAEIARRLLEIRSKRNQQGQAHKKDAKKKKVSEKSYKITSGVKRCTKSRWTRDSNYQVQDSVVCESVTYEELVTLLKEKFKINTKECCLIYRDEQIAAQGFSLPLLIKGGYMGKNRISLGLMTPSTDVRAIYSLDDAKAHLRKLKGEQSHPPEGQEICDGAKFIPYRDCASIRLFQAKYNAKLTTNETLYGTFVLVPKSIEDEINNYLKNEGSKHEDHYVLDPPLLYYLQVTPQAHTMATYMEREVVKLQGCHSKAYQDMVQTINDEIE